MAFLQKPLKGITVLDISRLLPGGFASLLLAKMGATVIKVEQPQVGDYYRALSEGEEFVDLGHFQEIHRKKLFVSLDLKKESDRKSFLRLVRLSDVVIENFRPGVLKRLGVGFHVLKRANKKIVLCSITGSGQTGHHSRLGGHDLNYLAASGLLSMIADKKGEPVLPDFQIVDLAAGYRSVALILAALCAKTRKSVWIDSSMNDAGLEMAALYKSSDTDPLVDVPNYQIYKTRDRRHVAFAALEPKFLVNFSRAIGRPVGQVQKMKKRDLQKVMRSKTLAQWVRLQEKYDFCLSPVLNVTEACGTSDRKRLPPIGRDNKKILR